MACAQSLWSLLINVGVLFVVVESAGDLHADCRNWAKSGECTKNPEFMQENCAASCQDNPLDELGEPEQCAGWALQGECTRNPKYMLAECPRRCKQQRASVHEAVIDDRLDCIDVATLERCESDVTLRNGCAGS